MSLFDRIAHSQEHTFIALRTNGLLALALTGLATSSSSATTEANGLVLLPAAPGHVITDEMVAEALLDD